MNKKAQHTASHKLIILILVVVVIVLAIYLLYRAGVLDYFKNLFPEFGKKEDTEKMIAEQAAVPEKEKARGYTSEGKETSKYPVIRLYYTQGLAITEDSFAFRWNPILNNAGGVQVLMNIRTWTDWKGKDSKEWLIHADLSNEFEKQEGIYDYEKEDVKSIMEAGSEEEMIRKIAEASKRRNVDIDFPISGQETSEGFAGGHAEVMSEKEIKYELMQYYPKFYEEDIENAIEEGTKFTSDEMKIYFEDSWSDDLVIVRWNFGKQKPEVILRPDGNKILENGQEVWVDSEEGVRYFLAEHNKLNNFQNTLRYPDLRSIESLFSADKPSELSKRIEIILRFDNVYTIYEITKSKNEELGLIDINGRVYGYENTNPDELFKLENEG